MEARKVRKVHQVPVRFLLTWWLNSWEELTPADQLKKVLQANLYYWNQTGSLQLIFYLCYCYLSCDSCFFFFFLLLPEDDYYWDLFKGKHCGRLRSQQGLGQKWFLLYREIYVWFFFFRGPYLICWHWVNIDSEEIWILSSRIFHLKK